MNSPNTVYVTWAIKTCPECGVHYALDAAFNNRNWELGQSWFCPNGHSLHFIEDKATKLDKQLAAATRQMAKNAEDRDYFAKRLDETDKELSTTKRTLKASKTRLRSVKLRVAAGVCPACNRTFQNLARHFETRHADYAKEHNHE